MNYRQTYFHYLLLCLGLYLYVSLTASGCLVSETDTCTKDSCPEIERQVSSHIIHTMSRKVEKVIPSKEQDEGMGARVRRSIGGGQLRNFDPFLLLDEFKVKKPAGFPDHPHRGFETWMTAGRGIVHCEMPEGEEVGHGLQLWVNLARSNKMVEPAYQELLDKDIPKTSKNGVNVKVIAGESLGVKSPVYTRTPTMYLDFKLEKDAVLDQPIPDGWNAFVYVLSGSAMFGPDGSATEGPAHNTLVLGPGSSLHVQNIKAEVCHFVLIGGQPLKEPVVQYGPFVMCTKEEIKQTEADYQYERNGFEGAHSWNSYVAYE